MALSSRGLFISFEGMDGSGKSTQLRLLAARLRDSGYTVVETAEPGGTPIGRQIRQVLLDHHNEELYPTAELLLYFACRAQNVDQWIRPALEAGSVVLSDRFTDSTRAYQGAARHLGGPIVESLHAIACRGIQPDLTLLVDIDLDTSVERSRSRDRDTDRMERQNPAFYQAVKAAYAEIAASESSRVRVVDGRAGIYKVAESIWHAVSPALPELPR